MFCVKIVKQSQISKEIIHKTYISLLTLTILTFPQVMEKKYFTKHWEHLYSDWFVDLLWQVPMFWNKSTKPYMQKMISRSGWGFKTWPGPSSFSLKNGEIFYSAKRTVFQCMHMREKFFLSKMRIQMLISPTLSYLFWLRKKVILAKFLDISSPNC